MESHERNVPKFCGMGTVGMDCWTWRSGLFRSCCLYIVWPASMYAQQHAANQNMRILWISNLYCALCHSKASEGPGDSTSNVNP